MIAPEARAVRVPSTTASRAPRLADDARPAGQVRPPVPVPPPVGPRTSAAPFAAVPSPAPEREAGRPSATALDERPPSVLGDIPSPAAAPLISQPVPELPSRDAAWPDGEHLAPWATGRGEIRAPQAPAGRPPVTPFVERRASRLPAGGVRPSTGPGESPVYGDWTKPSRPARMPAASAPVPPLPAMPAAPLTTAIPDRDIAARRAAGQDAVDDRYEDDLDHRFGGRSAQDHYEDDRYDDPSEGDRYDDQDRDSRRHEGLRRADLDDGVYDTPGPVTGTVVGGRAAKRAEREARESARLAAEAARRKAAGVDDVEPPRRPRRMLKGLLAVAAVAAVVTGVYTVASPGTEETAADRSAPVTHTPAPIAPTSAPEITAALPPLDTEPTVAETAPATPVRVPVTVLNATRITGLAAKVSEEIGGKGWETAEPAGYPKSDIAASTVYFTKGDDKQRKAALQLVEQFPQLTGPAERFFEVPAEVDAPGLVVVVTGDWKS